MRAKGALDLLVEVRVALVDVVDVLVGVEGAAPGEGLAAPAQGRKRVEARGPGGRARWGAGNDGWGFVPQKEAAAGADAWKTVLHVQPRAPSGMCRQCPDKARQGRAANQPGSPSPLVELCHHAIDVGLGHLAVGAILERVSCAIELRVGGLRVDGSRAAHRDAAVSGHR